MHKIALSKGAARWLLNYLGTPGIFATAADIFNAGTLMAGPLAPVETIAKELQENPEALAAWLREDFTTLEISEKQRETVKRGLAALAGKGALELRAGTHRFTMELLTAFGVTE